MTSLKDRVVTRHALERAAERYDLDLSKDNLREMQALIRANDPRAVLLGHRPGDSHMVAIHWGGQWCCCVAENGVIVTFLPPHEFAHYLSFLEGIDPATGLPKPAEIAPPDPRSNAQNATILFRPDAEESERLRAILRPAGKPKVKAIIPPTRKERSAELPTIEEIEAMAVPASESLDDLQVTADRLSDLLSRFQNVPDPNRIISHVAAARKDLKRRLWWASYRLEAERAKVDPPTDPETLLRMADKLIDSLAFRIGYEQLTVEDEAIRHLICRWVGRAKYGNPPSEFRASNPDCPTA